MNCSFICIIDACLNKLFFSQSLVVPKYFEVSSALIRID
jgi:hypothetical protein